MAGADKLPTSNFAMGIVIPLFLINRYHGYSAFLKCYSHNRRLRVLGTWNDVILGWDFDFSYFPPDLSVVYFARLSI